MVVPCPDFTNIMPNAIVIMAESTCTVFGGTPMGGQFTPPPNTCPVGSSLKYSIDNGMTYLASVPTYNQVTAITVLTACACDTDPTMLSSPSTVMAHQRLLLQQEALSNVQTAVQALYFLMEIICTHNWK